MADEGLYSIAPGETPQAVSSRRKIAEALMMQGMQTTPIQHWAQGAARLAQALAGGYGMQQADEQDASGIQNAMKQYSAGMFGDSQPQSATPGTLPSPSAPDQSVPTAPDVVLPPNRALKSIPLDAQRPPQNAIAAALSGPSAGPAIIAPTGWQRPQGAPSPAGSPPMGSSPSPAAGPSAAATSPRPDPKLIAALTNPYLPKPLAELGIKKAEQQMKPDEWKHFTAGDRNMIYNPTQPGQVRDLNASGENRFQNVAEMRKEIHQLPSYQNWTKRVDPTYRSMVDSMHTDSKASDVNLVYGMATIFDPNSVVREGEQIIIRSTASLPEWLVGNINGLNGGARLGPETRKALMTEATSRAKEHYDAVVNDIAPYHGIAQRFGMRPQDIVPPIRPLPNIPAAPGAATAGGGPAPRPAPAGVDPKVWAVMTPQERALWK